MELSIFQEYRVKSQLNPSPFSMFDPNELNIKRASPIQGVPEKKPPLKFQVLDRSGPFWTVLERPIAPAWFVTVQNCPYSPNGLFVCNHHCYLCTNTFVLRKFNNLPSVLR